MTANSTSSYLKNLHFPDKLGHSLIARYFRNPRLPLLLVIAITLLGTFSFITLPKVLYPDIDIPVVVITTTLPGASPSDIESLITIPIEDQIKGLNGLQTYQSTSRESASIIYLEFDTNIDPDKARSDTQSAIDELTDLPDDVGAPQVVKYDYVNQPVLTFALVSRGDNGSLIRFAKILEDELKSLPAVDKIETAGLEEQEIQIDIDPETIVSYQISPSTIAQAIQTALQAYPAGTTNTDQLSFSLNINQAITSVDDFRTVQLNLNGTNVALGEIATISEKSKPDQIQSYYVSATDQNPIPAVTFNVYRNSNVTITDAVHDVQTEIDSQLSAYPDQFMTIAKFNQADEIDEQFNRLVHDLTFTIILIVITMFIFLGIKQASVASLAVPFSFLITFAVMKFVDVDFSTVSFLALLLALGLLIDDTIVVISAMTSYYRTGKFTPDQTTLLVWKDFLIAITTTTLTTIFAFLPILITTGIIGEFIQPVPVVVSTALAASFVVAMFITMPFMKIALQPKFPRRVQLLIRFLLPVLLFLIFILLTFHNRLFFGQLAGLFAFLIISYYAATPLLHRFQAWIHSRTSHTHTLASLFNRLTSGLISFDGLTQKYQRLISRILSSRTGRKKAMIIILAFCVFCYSLAGFGLIQTQFFPKTDQDALYVNLEFPEGTNLETSKAAALELVPTLLNTPQLSYLSLDLGQVYTSDVNFTGTGSNKAFFTLNLSPKDDRDLASYDIAEQLRQELSDYPTGKLSIIEKTSGPPAGSDIQIKYFGNDLDQLDQLADETIDFLQNQSGVANIDKSVKNGTSKITFVPDQSKLAQFGINNSTIGTWLRILTSGFSIDEIRLNDQTKDITLRLQSSTSAPEDIGQLSIPTTSGYIPISNLGDFKLEPNPSLIIREDGIRTISVSASVTQGYSSSAINKQLTQYVSDHINLPDGYSWSVGGVNDENQKSTNSLLQAMIVAIILISVTMVIQFESFRKALIVILIIPLSISGVFLVFALTNTPLSFPALIGILALFGIVVKNSILVVDKISANLKSGMPYFEAIVDGSSSRLEAISLTSIAAILGLVPITISDPLWRGVGGAIISGLSFSGLIILFFIPIVYYVTFKKEHDDHQSNV